MKTAVIDNDKVDDFSTGTLKCESIVKINPKIQHVLDLAPKKKVPNICTYYTHLPVIDEEFEIWPQHTSVGTKGTKVIEELKPVKGDYDIQKHGYNAFFRAHLSLLLREFNFDTLALVGLVNNVCIQSTAADAFFRGPQVIVPEDYVEAINKETQEAGSECIKTICNCKITNVNELTGKNRLGE